MFVNIDYSKKGMQAKYYLAKPNKQVIGLIKDKYEDQLSVVLGNINEATFSIPLYIKDNKHIKQYNPFIEKIREKMLVKMTIGSEKEWFIVNGIEDTSDGEGKQITLIGLGYELKSKSMNIESEARNLSSLAEEILVTNIWKLGSVDTIFSSMYRSFESTKTNALDSIITLAETFGALIEWNTVDRIINFLDPKEYGVYKGLNFTDRLLEDVKLTSTSEEMVTKLYAYGDDNLTFSDVEPNGNAYLEDFSYFMNPFELDEDGKVIESSYYMSDELCLSIIAYNNLYLNNKDDLNTLINKKNEIDLEISNTVIVLDENNLELDNILDRLDVSKLTADAELIISIEEEKEIKNNEITLIEEEISTHNDTLNNTLKELNSLRKNISKEENFTKELIEELSLYEIEGIYEDSNIISPEDLYIEANKAFSDLKKPKLTASVSSVNLFNVVGEQYYWDKLVLGDYANVKYSKSKLDFRTQIVQIDYDFEEGLCVLSLSEDIDIFNKKSAVQNILYSSQGTTSIVNNKKSRWNEIESVGSSVSEILSSEWDANKNRIIAGINNSIDIGKRGIKVTNPTKPNEVVVMQSGIVAVSDDYGDTWKSALTADGLVAKRLNGQIITGEKLIIENENDLFQLSNTGMQFKAYTTEMSKFDGTSQTIQDFNDETNTSIESKVSGEEIIGAINLSSEINPIEGRRLSITKDTIFEDQVINSNMIKTMPDELIQQAINNITAQIDITTEGLESYSYNGRKLMIKDASLELYDYATGDMVGKITSDKNKKLLIEIENNAGMTINKKGIVDEDGSVPLIQIPLEEEKLWVFGDLDMKGFSIVSQTDENLLGTYSDTQVKGITETKKISLIDFEWDTGNSLNAYKPTGNQFGVDAQSAGILQKTEENGYYSVDVNMQINLNTKTNQELILENGLLKEALINLREELQLPADESLSY